jgi:hypothetical protein
MHDRPTVSDSLGSDSLGGLAAAGSLSKPGALWNKATSWLYRPAPIIERRSPGEFVPCHPEPLRKDPNLVQIVLGARHNLIGGWMTDHYRSADPLNPGGDFDATANVEQWSNARATQRGWGHRVGREPSLATLGQRPQWLKESGGRHRDRTCDHSRVKGVLYR